MTTTTHKVVSRETWLDSRRSLLLKEKAHTRAGDVLSQKRRELPWVLVDKQYVFEGPDGEVTLADLFDGRSQLIIQHFMFGPGWTEGCVGCSFGADHVDDARQHLEKQDVSFAAVARAPYSEFAPFKERMGWKFTWVSAFNNDFNSDYGVSVTAEDVAAGREMSYNYRSFVPTSEDEMPGYSVFYRDDDGSIYHTYSSYDRGGEDLINALNMLDIAPLGRNEKTGTFTAWVRLHDTYGNS